MGAGSVLFFYLSLSLMVCLHVDDVYSVFSCFRLLQLMPASPIVTFWGNWIISRGLSQNKTLNLSSILPGLVLSLLLCPVSLLLPLLDATLHPPVCSPSRSPLSLCFLGNSAHRSLPVPPVAFALVFHVPSTLPSLDFSSIIPPLLPGGQG